MEADMKKRLPMALAALGLATSGLVGFGADPASAHIFDGIAGFACLSTRVIPQQVNFTLVHAHPLWFNEHVIQEGCYIRYGTNLALECRWEALYWSNATVTGPYNITGDCLNG